MPSWKYLTRFVAAEDGATYYSFTSDVPKEGERVQSFDSIDGPERQASSKHTTVQKIIAPIAAGNPIVCIGLNYSNHAKEASLAVPTTPPMWYKPPQALAGPGDVGIPKTAQENFLDFEGEFTIITSKDAKDITVEEAPQYILGYTIGNDLTARLFQDPKRGGGQYSFAKSFDNFAPLGPVIVNGEHFGPWGEKTLKTAVNGRIVQDSPLDLIWGPAELVSFLSQGRTLPAHTAIMTGTPSGVGWFQKPQYSLKDGDVVDISIEGIGTLSNTMRYE